MKRAALVLVPVLLAAWLITAAFLDQRHSHLNAALVQAVNQRDAAQAGPLLASGADPNVRDWKTYYLGTGVPFRPPWYEKYLARVMHRTPRQADPYIGPTVLMIAAYHGDSSIVNCLLNHGADTAREGTGIYKSSTVPLSPLAEAMQSGSTASELLLIDHGTAATNNLLNDQDLAPLMNTLDPRVALALIDHGANVNAVNQDQGFTALLADLENPDCGRNAPATVQTITILLDHGADVNAKDADGETALMKACRRGGGKVAKLLLDRGADVNASLHGHDTALTGAAEENDLSAMALLLQHGADVNARDFQGATALMLVSYHGLESCLPPHSPWRQKRLEMQHLLLHFGANPHLKDRQGRIAADYETIDDPGQVCGP